MKYVILTLLLFSTAAQASWFSKGPDPIPEYKEKITALETKLSDQSHSLNHWEIATGSLCVACVLLFIIGTALGAQTRQNHHESGRMGPTPPTPAPNVNGSKPRIVRKAAEENTHQTLAA